MVQPEGDAGDKEKMVRMLGESLRRENPGSYVPV